MIFSPDAGTTAAYTHALLFLLPELARLMLMTLSDACPHNTLDFSYVTDPFHRSQHEPGALPRACVGDSELQRPLGEREIVRESGRYREISAQSLKKNISIPVFNCQVFLL